MNGATGPEQCRIGASNQPRGFGGTKDKKAKTPFPEQKGKS